MRFVVLHHTGWSSHSNHYDLMIQFAPGASDSDAVLITYATLTDEFPTPPVRLKLLADHRRAYLTFEGPLSGNRGAVTRVDEGEVEFEEPLTGKSEEIRIRLKGSKLTGLFQLARFAADLYDFEQI